MFNVPPPCSRGLSSAVVSTSRNFACRPGRLQRLPVRRRLGLLQPREQILGEERTLPVVPGVVRRVQPPVRLQVRADLGLEDDLVVVGHQTISRTSICPVTAAVINAARRSRASSMNRSVSAIKSSILAVCSSR